MSGISNNPNSPRQKMINLMYLVFIAMTALNTSVEVLDGFEIVQKGLHTSTENATQHSQLVMGTLDKAYTDNPAKVGEWYEKGKRVKVEADALYNYIEELKLRIVQEADGKEADVDHIKHKDNLDAASHVMLAPVVGEGKKLREQIETFRKNMTDLLGDPTQQRMVESLLSTEALSRSGISTQSWESVMFENMPVAAALTLLTKTQNDIRSVEGEVLSTLITNIDVGDYRVNKIQALVIPKSQIVTNGMPYEAQLVLAAVDSTKQPEYYLGDRKLDNNWLTIPTGGVGERSFSGKIIADGITYPFESKYSVTEATATIAPTLMNFLYESINNDLEIAMPGVPSGAVTARISSGSISLKEKNIWTAKGLNMKTAPRVTVTLTANVGGRTVSQSKEFTVRPLPPPTPFIAYQDGDAARKFKSGTISKRNLVSAKGVSAAIDDGVLNVPHTVTSFILNFTDAMGNNIPLASKSGDFTPQQLEYIRNLARGKRFYVSSIMAVDPAGKPVKVESAMEVIVN